MINKKIVCVDLYGLVYFLSHAPYCNNKWYNRLVWRPYLCGDHKPLLSLFAQLMWRNSKKEVSDEVSLLIAHCCLYCSSVALQLCIPEQREVVHWLSFSAVEAYYYSKQKAVCAADFTRVS